MASNGSHIRERLARLESERDQHRKEIDALSGMRETLEQIRQDTAKLVAWREKINSQIRRCARVVLWFAVFIGAQQASGPWAALLGDMAKQLLRVQ